MASATSDRLVGRHRELAGVSALVDGVVRGEATTLLIEGEAGIGKSLLVQSAIFRAS